MNFNLDFLKYFGEIEVVHINPTNMECQMRDFDKKFDIFHLYGKWEDETAEGGVDGSLGMAEQIRPVLIFPHYRYIPKKSKVCFQPY